MSDERLPNAKYDVAFSLLKQDVDLATNFSKAILPLSSFVFTERQADLAGTDGQESFRDAFRLDSRLNVILLRQGWGDTPWTRIEQMAIQERCLADGWNRLLVVNLDSCTPPRWIPQVNLYLDLQTFPFEQAVGAIKRQVQQLGGEIRPQSSIDLARAKVREVAFSKETKTLFGTTEGVQLARNAVERIREHLHMQLQKISDEEGKDWSVHSGFDGAGYGVVRAQGCSVLLNWQHYRNDCNDSELTVRIFPASFETPQEQKEGKRFMRFIKEDRPTYQRQYSITRDPTLGITWKNGGKIVTSETVADIILTNLVDAILSRS